MSHNPKTALLIGGGAPNSPLMAGALLAFLEAGLTFDVIATSGAGALMGLLYTAPKNGDPHTALRQWADMGVADAIYQWLPVNYKVFMKPGSLAAQYRDWLQQNPFTKPLYDPDAPFSHGIWADLTKLILATASPSDLNPNSLGLCANLPFADSLVDFDTLKQIKPEFYINAYNITRQEMAIWDKKTITAEHLKAAFAFPLIYPPYHLNDEYYIEGASIDTLNFKALVSDQPEHQALHRDLDTLIIFDILGADSLIRKPRNLYDAWVKSIITPLVEIARDDIRLFEYQHNKDPHTGRNKRHLLKVPLMAEITDWETVMDWSSSNLAKLFQLGKNAGEKFCQAHPELFK